MCNETEGEGRAVVSAVDFMGALLDGRTPDCPKGGKCALVVDEAAPFTADELSALRLGVKVARGKQTLRRYQGEAEPKEKVVAVSVKGLDCSQAAIYRADEEGLKGVWEHLITEIQTAMLCTPDPRNTADIDCGFMVQVQVWDKGQFEALGDFTGC